MVGMVVDQPADQFPEMYLAVQFGKMNLYVKIFYCDAMTERLNWT